MASLDFEQAIATSLIKYSESDCIVRLFCKRLGRVSAFAKGGLKPSKRRAGIIQAPVRVLVGLKPPKSGELYWITEFDVVSWSMDLASSSRSYGLTCYLCELVEKWLPELEPAEPIFDTLDEALRLLSQQQLTATHLRAFELKLLSFCGYLPDVSGPLDGHLGSIESLSKEAIELLQILVAKPLSSVPHADTTILREIGQIFVATMRHLGKGKLNSMEFLKQKGL